ncbi:MAG: hypothetical protein QOE29_2267, partial [Gaiellaceae bacterium]|nr:hypothetical protein [Gaiellaceae bacterium]
MRIALAQLNQIVGDLDGNRDRILGALADARDQGAQLVVFPELAVTGYPPEDLLLRPGFLRAAERTLASIAEEARDVVALVGVPLYDGDLFNACAVCAGGEVKAYARKRFLPNYGVFDEHRYFAAGREPLLLELDGTLVGVTICEDMWQPGPPASELALAGAELLVNVSASPFHVGRERLREEMFRARARDYVAMVAFCNLVGGQDELIFDGHSVVIDDEGEVLARADGFQEELLVVDLDPQAVIGRRLTDVRRRSLAEEQPAPELPRVAVATGPVPDGHISAGISPFSDELESMREALVLGLGDYVAKNGFREIVVGVSGGIDSALTAALAVDALGAGAVHCVSMPSRYSSEATRSDARALAQNLGAHFLELPIEPAVEAFHGLLAEPFAGLDPDLTEENLQARIRGVLLMALSNKHGWLLVATGNKSELSVGYATLYGDMAGGFALLKDVFKT